jgi:hypothetical protein
MKIKGSQEVSIGYQKTGRIFIDQYDQSKKDIVTIFLTPEQFRAIEDWFFRNQDEIDSAWNMGAENDPEA